jgi:hypothetical protein
MLVKMSPRASEEQVATIEARLHQLGFKTGKLIGDEITLIGVYGDITQLPVGELQEMSGVENLIPISRAYKRAAQKGSPDNPIRQTVNIGNVVVGGNDLTIVAGPCSVESEPQVMEAARMVKEAGANALRGGVVKYRSSPYSGWEGIGSNSDEALRNGLKLIVKAGREFELPTVVEILDPGDVPVYEDMGIAAGGRAQLKEPGSAESSPRHPPPRDSQTGQLAGCRGLSLVGGTDTERGQRERHPLRTRNQQRESLYAQHLGHRRHRSIPLPAVVSARSG